MARRPADSSSLPSTRRLITKRATLYAGLLCLASPAAGEVPGDLANIYRLDVRFDPATGALAVQGTMDIVADRPTTTARLLLNDALNIRSATLDGRPVRVEPGYTFGGDKVPGGQAISLAFDQPLATGQRARLAFRYDGRLTTDNIHVGRGVVSPAWTELTLESFWYPIYFEEPLLRSEMILKVPARYQVAGPGRVERIGPGQWRLDPQSVVSGRITFALSDRWHVEQRQLSREMVAALHTLRPEPRASEILGAIAGAHAAFQRLFGPPRTSKNRITVLLANADVGLKYPSQAFATAGDFIVMSNGEPQPQIDTLHHEVAHLWWSDGQPGTADEFLSESISEYLAMRYGGTRWGTEWLTRRRAATAARSAEIKGSFFTLDGLGSAIRQPLLYDRGPTALWSLHDRIGAAAMDRLLQDAWRERVRSLPAFLAALRRLHGEQTESWFRAQL